MELLACAGPPDVEQLREVLDAAADAARRPHLDDDVAVAQPGPREVARTAGAGGGGEPGPGDEPPALQAVGQQGRLAADEERPDLEREQDAQEAGERDDERDAADHDQRVSARRRR